MRVAIVGGGVSGSYLANLLSERHEVTVFEQQPDDRFFTVCAWGTSVHELRKLAGRIGLNFDDYIFFEGRRMIVDLWDSEMEIPLKGLCTFDKRRFVTDMHRSIEVVYGHKVVREPPSGYDLIVDATGFHRALLPRLERDYYIPTLEYKVFYDNPPYEDFYIKPIPGLSGYLWYFPLGDGVAHVGAGDYYKKHIGVLNSFMEGGRGEVAMRIGRPVRIAPPHLCRPMSLGPVYGVGESIGTVYPVLGEGIIPGMQCAAILAEHINEEKLEDYERTVLRKFRVYFDAFNFVKKKIKKEFSWFRDWPVVLKPFIHMKINEDRYGMHIRLRDWIRLISKI
ncbi:MAG: NAD(P)/FAD-dependent oxidoreductase [Aigarchaeota archaeon]|nr:NAD(P)/FAD-dependent oxidoreductase [Aigarchaeota archaeon]MDW8092468.1 NAD(P)/FAD-dependent oxidoreductase [Nitrososphaerota archaeon]